LEVQDHDTAVDQLHHRRATLPERGELADVDKRLAQLDTHTTDVNAQRDEIGARQGTLEHQIEASRARRTTLEQRLYGGTVAAARDLQAMSDEVRHLARHISELEDRELEVMEALEPLDAALQTAADERKGLEADAARLRAAIADAEAALDVDIAARVEARGVAAQGVRDELLGRYEQLRTKLGGTGAARLVGGSCSGCHLALPSMELDRLRRSPPDSVITCEQCGRILVR
jgi:predicted  nucleic acid-binding Zn-ribbon protein